MPSMGLNLCVTSAWRTYSICLKEWLRVNVITQIQMYGLWAQWALWLMFSFQFPLTGSAAIWRAGVFTNMENYASNIMQNKWNPLAVLAAWKNELTSCKKTHYILTGLLPTDPTQKQRCCFKYSVRDFLGKSIQHTGSDILFFWQQQQCLVGIHRRTIVWLVSSKSHH